MCPNTNQVGPTMEGPLTHSQVSGGKQRRCRADESRWKYLYCGLSKRQALEGGSVCNLAPQEIGHARSQALVWGARVGERQLWVPGLE